MHDYSTLADRFVLKTRKSARGCVEWIGCVGSRHGYGKVHVDVRCRPETAHRVAYQLFIGPIPDGLFVLHSCDNRRCVSPTHLVLGTHQDNMDDMVRKGRATQTGFPGEANGRAILTAPLVIEARSLAALVGQRPAARKMAGETGVSEITLRQAIRRVTWKHI